MFRHCFVKHLVPTLRHVCGIHELPSLPDAATQRCFSAFTASVPRPKSSNISPQLSLSQVISPQAWVNGQCVRTNVRVHYIPNPSRRIKKHGIHKRIETEGGLSVLWRRYLKGRHNLAVYEDFRPLLKQYQRPPRKVKW